MNKFLIYTSNLGFVPRDMEDIVDFAQNEPKFRISNVELNASLANVEAGDNIITGKGNSLYVIRALDTSLDNLSQEDSEYVDRITRSYGLKKVNITSVEQIIKFNTWCKSAKTLIKNLKVRKMSTNSVNSMMDRIKNSFMPIKAEGVRIAQDGNICVSTNEGYVAIDANNELTTYPEEFTCGLPVFIISKPVAQLQAGDVISKGNSYYKITKIDGDKINAIGYTGASKTIHTIKDFIFNQTLVRVLISLAGNIGGQINPLLMMAMSDGDNSSMLPLLMMSQQNGAMGMNPMLMMMLADKGDDKSSSTKDLLMMAALSGGNFGGIFGGNTAAPTAAAKPAKKQAKHKKEIAKEAPDVEKAE